MPSKTRPEKPRVTIIGVGRLGTALAVALHRKHYPIEALVAVHLRSAKKAATLLDVPVLTLAAKDLESYRPQGVVVIATPDDQIENVAKKLSGLPECANRVVIHTSGALSSSVLSSPSKKGWGTGSLHPLVSVSDPIAGARQFPGAFWCVEGDAPARRIAQAIVRDLEGQSFSVKPEQKALYHAAAVMTSGNIVALFDVALEMMMRCGLSRKDAKKVLLPLLVSTVANLSVSDPSSALTGTFSRADEATVHRHLKAFSENHLKNAAKLYRILGQRSVSLAMHRGANQQALKRILRKLKN